MQVICGGLCGRDKSGGSEEVAGRAGGKESRLRGMATKGKRRRRVEAGTRRGNGDAGNQSFHGTEWRASLDTLMMKVATSRRQVKSSRKESEASGEEGEEVESPKRKVLRVECEDGHRTT